MGWSMDVRQSKADLVQAPVKSCCLATLTWKTSSAAQVLLEQKEGLENAGVDIGTEHETAEEGAAGYKDLGRIMSVVVLRSVCPAAAWRGHQKPYVYTAHKLSVKSDNTPHELILPPCQNQHGMRSVGCVKLVRRVTPRHQHPAARSGCGKNGAKRLQPSP